MHDFLGNSKLSCSLVMNSSGHFPLIVGRLSITKKTTFICIYSVFIDTGKKRVESEGNGLHKCSIHVINKWDFCTPTRTEVRVLLQKPTHLGTGF